MIEHLKFHSISTGDEIPEELMSRRTNPRSH